MNTDRWRRVQIVDRPPLPSRSKYPVDALLGTVNTKKAVRVRFDGIPAKTVIMSLHQVAHRTGHRLRYRQERTALIAWLERKTEKGA